MEKLHSLDYKAYSLNFLFNVEFELLKEYSGFSMLLTACFTKNNRKKLYMEKKWSKHLE